MSLKSLQVGKLVCGWTSWPAQVGVGLTVSFTVAVMVVDGTVCVPTYNVEEEVVYGSEVEHLDWIESNSSTK